MHNGVRGARTQDSDAPFAGPACAVRTKNEIRAPREAREGRGGGRGRRENSNWSTGPVARELNTFTLKLYKGYPVQILEIYNIKLSFCA